MQTSVGDRKRMCRAKPPRAVLFLATLLPTCATRERTPPAQPLITSAMSTMAVPPSSTAPHAIAGRVTFEARTVTPRGYSAAIEIRPARFVTVRLLDVAGHTLAETHSDAQGRFAFEPHPSASTVAALASIHASGDCPLPSLQGPWTSSAPARACEPRVHLDVTSDPMGQQPYEITAPVVSRGQTELRASLHGPRAEGGAFHILDTLARGVRAVHAWTGRDLPPLYAYWQHEGPSDWSYYRGERPAGSGRYALELMGGEPGRSAVTDSDEHDESIILHEFGHFVFDRLSTDSSIGGLHPAHVLTDPGVAWEEGRATWFAGAVMGTSLYRDAVGIEPQGSVRQDDDMEQFPPTALRGLGSQRSVEEVLWDLSDGTLSDGTTPLADRDDDGVAIGPAAVLRAMISLRDVPEVYPSVATFLRHLVSTNVLPEERASALLQRPTAQGFTLPRAGQPDLWPRDLAPGASARDMIDGLSDPAPSGGSAHPVNGFDAVHAYRIRVQERGRLRAELVIQGSGRVADHSDLDLELRSLRADMIAQSASEAPIERVERPIEPGAYVLYVRDGGRGNRARYALRWALLPAH